MKFDWNEASYRWFRESSEYTGYNGKLADILLGKLAGEKYRDLADESMGNAMEVAAATRADVSENRHTNVNKHVTREYSLGTLCDMGCGAAEIDLELSPYFEDITCVDINENVIHNIEKTITNEGYTNIHPVIMDGINMKKHFDVVMAIYHARDINRILKYLEIADKALILVVRGSRITEVGVNQYKALDCFESESMKASLEQAGIRYEYSTHTLEHGQPFRNLEEAIEFVKRYCEITDDAKAREYMETKIIRTGEDKYPYYLPKTKKMGIFMILRAKLV